MNTYHAKNNIYKNGNWKTDNSKAMAIEKAKSIVPTQKTKEYRDDLYNFCVQKGILTDFPLARTKDGMNSNIRAFITIIRKNGLADEFFRERKDNDL